MARAKKEPLAMPVKINEELVRQDIAEADAMHSIEKGYTESRDLVNQLLGQIQMAKSFARFADVVSLSKLKHIKETKAYRALAGKKGFDPDGNEIADVGTFDGFCQVLGLSRSKVDEDLTNLSIFGEEALKSLSAIGAGYRELRQYRRLPEDQKTALIEVAKTGDKDSFLDLAEELIARHTKEKEAFQQQLAEQTERIEAKNSVIDQKNKKITELVDDKNRRDGMTEAEQHAELDNRLTKGALLAAGSILALRKVVHEIRSLERCPQGMYVAMQGALDRVIAEAMAVATDYGIQLKFAEWFDERPEYTDPNVGETFDPASK